MTFKNPKSLVIFMGDDRKKGAAGRKAGDGEFSSKNIKHDPQAESARAVFGLRGDTKKRQPNAGREHEKQ